MRKAGWSPHAKVLTLSVSTVRFHLRNAAEKLGATTRARMIQIATGHGFLGPDA
ncbi:hypothetical protein F1C10_02220 [Sphingomonas sp. NBWT7]|uniref:LuxR C-terminal-related transcriptional regulator n=1 Tax=Sphingomonas sp. NBWT7 TaxID=2596913 RepID=UPI0016278BC0|nr:LuxR C-terminal-related transcriptional regulator [Sphingomonas sp. NBWT7]QNE30894.1 hypothetical protein F1C10_02220 [Sphingomonas sp. NBWT7]